MSMMQRMGIAERQFLRLPKEEQERRMRLVEEFHNEWQTRLARAKEERRLREEQHMCPKPPAVIQQDEYTSWLEDQGGNFLTEILWRPSFHDGDNPVLRDEGFFLVEERWQIVDEGFWPNSWWFRPVD